MTLVLECYTPTEILLRCVSLEAADLLYGSNYTVLGHPCDEDEAEADTWNMQEPDTFDNSRSS